MPVRGKSGKKPLRDVSNFKYGRTSSKSVATAKRKENDNRSKIEEQDDALDRLLLVQSDLSALTHQVHLSNFPPFRMCLGFSMLLCSRIGVRSNTIICVKFCSVHLDSHVWIGFIPVFPMCSFLFQN